MNWKQVSFYIGLPLAILVLYTAGMIVCPQPGEKLTKWIFSEQGIVEVGTAVFYFFASLIAFLLFYKISTRIGKWRVIYLLIGLAALFIALEEVNYGQYFFGFDTPDEVKELNRKGEFNFHNMFENRPARRLNTLATIAFPTLFLALPVLALRHKNDYDRGKWPYYVLPNRRLVLFVVIGQFMSWYDDIFRLFGLANTWTRATELKEFYWALAVMLWMIMLYKRIILGPNDSPEKFEQKNHEALPEKSAL